MTRKNNNLPQGGTHTCYLCGKIIDGDYGYVKTKRGSELYMHPECVIGGKGNGNK